MTDSKPTRYVPLSRVKLLVLVAVSSFDTQTMTAATLTKQLIKLNVQHNEDQFIECLTTILKEFLATRNPVFPRQVNILFLPNKAGLS